ncbi:MAG: hypothetical protein ACLRX5_04335 [Slackia sp.]
MRRRAYLLWEENRNPPGTPALRRLR